MTAVPVGFEVANEPCGVCGAARSSELMQLDLRHWSYPHPFVLRRCEGCGLLFNSPRLQAEGLNALYDEGYYFFNRPLRVELRRIVGAYRRTMAHVDRAPGTLLEVGSAKGYMLAVLARLGWRVTGVELSPPAAESARRRFGVEVFTGPIDAFRARDGRRFDVVLAQDVLEHVPDPVAFLRSLYDATAPGGWVVIDTPNGGARNIAAVGGQWRGFNPFHIFLFDRGSLETALRAAGLTPVRMGSYNDVPPQESITRRLEASADAPAPAGALLRARAAASAAADVLLRGRALRDAVQACRTAAPTPLNPDAIGDNLVAIARRPPV